MSKIIVASAPRSGTHMLTRMISKAMCIPWCVPVPSISLKIIKESEWVAGVHDTYQNILENCPEDSKIICLKRIKGHKESLSRMQDSMPKEKINEINDSFPEELTVIYDEIIKPSKKELDKINDILGIDNIELEPWDKRYDMFVTWRRYKHDKYNR